MTDLNLKLYRKVYLIRRAEEAIIQYYGEDEMKTPMHMSMGEEALVAGACTALGKDAAVFGSYRSHALYLAMTEESDQFFAELYGKVSGAAKGVAGSMHLAAPQHGLIAVSAVVATTLPLAVGHAFASRYQGQNKTTAVFFGDGALDEGVFWESLNLAALMKLPVLFICEDNGLAVHTYPNQRQGYKSITEIVKQFNCQVYQADSTDPEVIYQLVHEANQYAQQNSCPVFLHLKYYRYLEHVGVNPDFNAGYRDQDEFEMWHQRDPVKLQRHKLVAQGVTETVLAIEAAVDQQVYNSVAFAKQSPFSDLSQLYQGVFAHHA